MSKTLMGFGYFGLICDCVCVILVLMLDLIGFAIWVFRLYGPLYIKIEIFFNGALNFVIRVECERWGLASISAFYRSWDSLVKVVDFVLNSDIVFIVGFCMWSLFLIMCFNLSGIV